MSADDPQHAGRPRARARRWSSESERASTSWPPTSRPILMHTKDMVFMEDGEVVVLRPDGPVFTDLDGKPIDEDADPDPLGPDHGGEGRLQALHAQGDPRAAPRDPRHAARPRLPGVGLGAARRDRVCPTTSCEQSKRMAIVACGTSWHAGLVGKFLIERLAGVPVEVDYASEFRYRHPLVDDIDAAGLHQPVRRDRRHAGRAARGQGQGGAQSLGHLQRAGFDGDPRGRGNDLHPRRPGNRRGLDQGVHQPAGRHHAAGAQAGPGARQAVRRKR